MGEYTEGDKMVPEDPIQVAPASPPPYEVDCEKHGAKGDSNPLPDLKRTLKSRHLQMIAIGVLAVAAS
jgi:amino acid transporter